MASIAKWATGPAPRPPLVPLQFPATGYDVIPESVLLEEEELDEFKGGRYYPVHIGDVLASKYQVLGKLGFGTTSTVWLARNLGDHEHVSLKVYTRGREGREEFEILETIEKANPSHPGYGRVRTALDVFQLQRPGGDDHACLVQRPMWESWKHLLRRNASRRFTEPFLKASLRHLFRALDYLHTECRLVHTDIKADNILQDIADPSILEAFTKAELTTPSPRKVVDDVPVYQSRPFELPQRFGGPVLSDFGEAVRGDLRRNHDAQPNVYRSPEVMLQIEWSYPVDIWNIGVMIWDVFEGRHLFYGTDPEYDDYSTRAHLAELIGTLGPPPLELLSRGHRSREFFTQDGEWMAMVPIPSNTSLESCETFLEGENKKGFLNLMRGMLQWRPEDRKTAKELLQDPWINS